MDDKKVFKRAYYGVGIIGHEIEILCGKMEGGVRSPRLKLQRFL